MDTDKHSRFYVPLSVSSAVSLLYLLGSAYESSFPVVPVPLAMTAEKAVLGRTRSARDDAERTSAAAIELMAEAARTPSRDRKTGTDLEHATHTDQSLTTVMDNFRKPGAHTCRPRTRVVGLQTSSEGYGGGF